MSKCVQNREQVLGPYVCVLGVLRICEHLNVYVSNLHRNQSHKVCVYVWVCVSVTKRCYERKELEKRERVSSIPI